MGWTADGRQFFLITSSKWQRPAPMTNVLVAARANTSQRDLERLGWEGEMLNASSSSLLELCASLPVGCDSVFPGGKDRMETNPPKLQIFQEKGKNSQFLCIQEALKEQQKQNLWFHAWFQRDPAPRGHFRHC